jgi:hypothetical protein
MRNLIFLILIMSLGTAVTVFAQQDIRDVVHLKDGTMIRGVIVEMKPDDYIKIRTVDGIIMVYEIKDILKIDQVKYDYEKEFRKLELLQKEKDPAIAFMMSLVIPGTGQYYNGQIIKGIIQEGLILGSALYIIITASEFDAKPGDLPIIGASIVMFSSYLWSVIDAPFSANTINKKLRIQQFGHLLEFGIDHYCVGFDIGASGKSAGAGLTLHF